MHFRALFAASFSILNLLNLVGCAGSSASERINVADHSIDILFDDSMRTRKESNEERAHREWKEALTKGLAHMKALYPTAFAREAPRLVRFDVRGGTNAHDAPTLVAVLDAPKAELVCPQGDVTEALGQDFRRSVEARFRGRELERIAPAEGAEWYDWARLGGVPSDVVIGAVARFALTPTGTSNPAVAKHARWYLVGQADDLSRAGYGLAPPTPAQTAVRPAYVQWLTSAMPLLDADQRLTLAPALFREPPRPQDVDYGYARTEPHVYWHFDGIDVFAFGLANADGWVLAGQKNALLQWVQNALATDAGRSRLAQSLGTRPDTRLVDGVFRALKSDRTRTETLMRALEPYPQAFQAAQRASSSS